MTDRRYLESARSDGGIAVPSAPPLSWNQIDITSSLNDPFQQPCIEVDHARIMKPLYPRLDEVNNDTGLLKGNTVFKGPSGESGSFITNDHYSKISKNTNSLCKITPPPDAVDDEPEPSAPPLELMDKVHGYEGASFDAVEIPPPVVHTISKTEEEFHRDPLPSGPQMTEQEARQALLKYTAAHCCYGKSAARDMAITKMDHSSAFHYTLESFTEKRQTLWAFEPYTGGTIDGSSSGTAPTPWEIEAISPSMFQNHQTQIEVPHTSSVKTCHICGGVGRKRCFTCSGNGWEYCYSCHGDGQKPTLQGERERCFQCHGTGRRRCWKCNGDGLAVCRGCAGTGQIKCFIKLTVTWTNHTDDHVVEKAAAIPDDKIRSVSGQVVFQEEHSQLWPINHFPDTTINMASVQLIQEHSTAFPAEKLLMQRHQVRIIPVAAISYKWKNHDGIFYVYGFEHKVYAPDYPQTCCCGCNIL